MRNPNLVFILLRNYRSSSLKFDEIIPTSRICRNTAKFEENKTREKMKMFDNGLGEAIPYIILRL